jgi:hypothetical protein
VVFAASLRASSASQPNTRTMIGYSRRNAMDSEHAAAGPPGETPAHSPTASSGTARIISGEAIRGGPRSRGINEGSLAFARPIFLSPVASRDARGPSAFSWASRPAVTSDARQGEDRPSDTGLRSRPRYQPNLQPTQSAHNVHLSCRTRCSWRSVCCT